MDAPLNTLVWVIVGAALVALIIIWSRHDARKASERREAASLTDQSFARFDPGIQAPDLSPVVTRTYRGTPSEVEVLRSAEADLLAGQGYVQSSQSYLEGKWGFGSYLAALLLCFVVVGFLILVYMLVMKPPGTLTVTYTRAEAAPHPHQRHRPQPRSKPASQTGAPADPPDTAAEPAPAPRL